MKTWRKASLAVLSSMAVFATAAGLSAFAGTPDTIADLVTPVQNFDALAAGAVNPVPEPNKGGVLGHAGGAQHARGVSGGCGVCIRGDYNGSTVSARLCALIRLRDKRAPRALVMALPTGEAPLLAQ